MAISKFKLSNRADFITPVGRLSYLYLFDEPNKYNEQSSAYWSATVFWDLADLVIEPRRDEIAEFYAAMRLIETEFFENFKKENAQLIPGQVKDFLRPFSGLRVSETDETGQNNPAQLRTKTGYREDWVNAGRPAFFDRKGQQIGLEEARQLIYSGCYGRISGQLRTSMFNPESGVLYITYSPRGVQFYADGDPLGASRVNMDSLAGSEESENVEAPAPVSGSESGSVNPLDYPF